MTDRDAGRRGRASRPGAVIAGKAYVTDGDGVGAIVGKRVRVAVRTATVTAGSSARRFATERMSEPGSSGTDTPSRPVAIPPETGAPKTVGRL